MTYDVLMGTLNLTHALSMPDAHMSEQFSSFDFTQECRNVIQ